MERECTLTHCKGCKHPIAYDFMALGTRSFRVVVFLRCEKCNTENISTMRHGQRVVDPNQTKLFK